MGHSPTSIEAPSSRREQLTRRRERSNRDREGNTGEATDRCDPNLGSPQGERAGPKHTPRATRGTPHPAGKIAVIAEAAVATATATAIETAAGAGAETAQPSRG